MGGCCCPKEKPVEQIVVNKIVNRVSSALGQHGTWNYKMFQYENLKLSKLLNANHFLIFPRQNQHSNSSGEIKVLVKLMYQSIENRAATPSVNDRYAAPNDQRELYPISLLIFPVKQNIINYRIPKVLKFKVTDCAYFNINLNYGQSCVIVPVVKQLSHRNIDFRVEVRPREDTGIINLVYNTVSRRLESVEGDKIKVHMKTCYGCKRFLFEEDHIVQQRGLFYHYNCAKYTCQLCNYDIENRNQAILCEGMVYHKDCLDVLLLCTNCNQRPARCYSPQLCDSCNETHHYTQNETLEAHEIKFSD